MKSNNVKIGGGGSLGKDKQRSQSPWRKPGIVRLFPGLRHGLCGGLCIALLLLAASAAAQNEPPQTIVYPDDPNVKLQHIWSPTDLAPTGTYQEGGTRDGWSDSLNNNHITVNSGTIGIIFGAYYEITTSGHPVVLPLEMIGNQIIVQSGVVGIGVLGGHANVLSADTSHVTVNENTVTIHDGTFSGAVVGGRAYSETPTGATGEAVAAGNGNRVIIHDGTFGTAGIYGGEAVVGGRDGTADALAEGNVLTIADGNFSGFVRGGYAWANSNVKSDARAEGNILTITGGNFNLNVYGGDAQISGAMSEGTAVASDNHVKIEGGTFEGNDGVFGGRATAGTTYSSHQHREVIASGNSVTIEADKIDKNVFGGHAAATASSSNNAQLEVTVTASENMVTISGSTIEGSVHGGYASINVPTNVPNATGTFVAVAEGNEVTISGGVIFETVYGGTAEAENRDGTAEAESTGNMVNITGGAVASIHGGNAYAESTDGDAIASASDNMVNISGGWINWDVVGGFVGAGSTNGDAVAFATGNIVNISGEVTFEERSRLYGGFIVEGTGDAFTGNTLNLSSSITVTEVENFEFYHFTLPADMQPGDTILTVSGTAVLGNGDGTPSKITANTLSGTAPFQEGEQITLIGTTGTGSVTGDVSPTGAGTHGAMLVYDFGMAIEDNQLRATVESVRTSPESKILSEGFLAGSILLNQTGDMIAQRTEQTRCGAFFDISFGDSRYNTGSHIDMKGFSLLTGITRCVNTASGKMTYGAFFEYGNGNDTGLYITGARGNSDVYHYGGGLLGRLNLRNSVYAEGSFRAGGMDNGFTSNLLDGQGNAAGYDSSSAYIGTHLGLGRKLKLSSRNTWDVYGKYFWTHQNGGRVTLSTNDPVRFESIDSHRMRLGGRSTSAVNRRLSTYWGAAWEHEFAGTAKATTYGYAIDSPSLRGSTGIGELGVSLKSQRALALDLGVQGYIGKREGIAGSAQVRWMW